MTKSDIPLTENCTEDGPGCTPSQEPTATVIPDTAGNPYSTIMPSKCAVITTARNKEDEVFKVFTKSLQLYKPDQVMFSFNGGKDCTVVLHMLHKFYQNHALQHIRLPVLYIQAEDSFSEVDRFVQECTEIYNIHLIRRKGTIKQALIDVLKCMPKIKAVFMGNRRTDPYCTELQMMQPTDPGWPPLMRINPILDWTYSDVWTYIIVFKVPYCILYEMGFTSIGTRKNTIPNPHLRIKDSGSLCGNAYHPAYMLEDGALERAGRLAAKKQEEPLE